MIVFRALQGFLGGSMIPMVFTTAFVFFQGPQRVIAAAGGRRHRSLAPTLGPTIGGWITDHYSWQWLFFINLVPGIFVSIAVPLLVRIDRPDLSLLRSADLPGIVLHVAVPRLPRIHARGRPALGLVGRPRHTHHRLDFRHRLRAVRVAQPDYGHPVVDLRALKRPQLRARLPVFLRHRDRHLRHHLPDAGVPGPGARLLRAADRPGGAVHRRVPDAGDSGVLVLRQPGRPALADDGRPGLLRAVDVGVRAHHPRLGLAELLLPQALRGIGQQFAIPPTVTLTLGGLAPARLRQASGLFNLMRNLGGALGIAVCATLLNSRTNLHFYRLAEHLTARQRRRHRHAAPGCRGACGRSTRRRRPRLRCASCGS
jgi:DHA2 family multidrug resistance protein